MKNKNTRGLMFVTSNENKFREFQKVFGTNTARYHLELDEIQEMDLEKIIAHKAKQAYSKLKRSVIVEDTGLFITAWDGFPGPFIKWFDFKDNYGKLASFVPKNCRDAKWVVTYGFYDGKTILTCTGELQGKISNVPKGTKGWGFMPVFIPKGYTKTFAELGEGLKNKIGARFKALRRLKKVLANHNK